MADMARRSTTTTSRSHGAGGAPPDPQAVELRRRPAQQVRQHRPDPRPGRYHEHPAVGLHVIHEAVPAHPAHPEPGGRMPVLDVAGKPLGPVARTPYDQAVPASARAAGRRHREGVPLAPLAADPDELSQRTPSRERDHDHLAGDRGEGGRQAAHAQPGMRHERDERGQQQHRRLAEQPGQGRARRQRPSRLDRNDGHENPQRRPAAEPVDPLEAVMPGLAHPVPGGTRHDDSDREHPGGRGTRGGAGRHGERGRDREPGHACYRHRAVQLPQVVGELMQRIRGDQPPQHEHSAHDSVVTRGHRDVI